MSSCYARSSTIVIISSRMEKRARASSRKGSSCSSSGHKQQPQAPARRTSEAFVRQLPIFDALHTNKHFCCFFCDHSASALLASTYATVTTRAFLESLSPPTSLAGSQVSRGACVTYQEAACNQMYANQRAGQIQEVQAQVEQQRAEQAAWSTGAGESRLGAPHQPSHAGPLCWALNSQGSCTLRALQRCGRASAPASLQAKPLRVAHRRQQLGPQLGPAAIVGQQQRVEARVAGGQALCSRGRRSGIAQARRGPCAAACCRSCRRQGRQCPEGPPKHEGGLLDTPHLPVSGPARWMSRFILPSPPTGALHGGSQQAGGHEGCSQGAAGQRASAWEPLAGTARTAWPALLGALGAVGQLAQWDSAPARPATPVLAAPAHSPPAVK